MIRSLMAALFVSMVSVTIVNAATYNISGSFSGGQLGTVNFDFDVTADFTANIMNSPSGLSINSITSTMVSGDPFPIAGGYVYSYVVNTDTFSFGGLANGVNGINSTMNDFHAMISDFTTNPSIYIEDTLSSQSDIGFPSSGTVAVKALAPVPLPAGLPLLLSGLAGVAGLRMRRKRRASQA